MRSIETLGAIILAAGKGKRMKSKTANKVTLKIADKPIILHAVHLLKNLSLQTIIVVVGFAKTSVEKALSGEQVLYTEQKKRLGTAHAVMCAMKKLPENITDVLIIQGDDSAFYTRETMEKLVDKHLSSDSSITFLTIELDIPIGLGRVVRDTKDTVISIIEEKDGSEEVRNIKEINPACYVFTVKFLKEYLKKIEKSPVTKEYYLTSLIDMAIKNKQKIETVRGGKIPWRGVNTPDELSQANRLYSVLK